MMPPTSLLIALGAGIVIGWCGAKYPVQSVRWLDVVAFAPLLFYTAWRHPAWGDPLLALLAGLTAGYNGRRYYEECLTCT